MKKNIILFSILLFVGISGVVNAQVPFGFGGGGGGSYTGPTVDPGTIEGQVMYWDSATPKWTPATGPIWDEVNSSFILPAGSVSNPALAFGDGDSGFYEVSDDGISVSIAGTRTWDFRSTFLGGVSGTINPRMQTTGGVATVPAICPRSADLDTGVGFFAGDSLNFIAGGNEILRAYYNSGPEVKLPYDGSNSATFNVDSSGILSITPTSGSVVLPAGSVTNPSIAFGDGDSGWFEASDDTLTISIAGTSILSFGSSGMRGILTDSGRFFNENATSTNPTLCPSSSDTDTGIGWNAAGQLSLISDSTETVRVTTTETQIRSGQHVNVTTVNAATYDLLATDYILNVTYTGTAAVTSLTLPTAQTVDGRVVVVKDSGGGAGTYSITIDTGGSETIDGAATNVLNVNYQSVSLYSDGSNWFVY